MCQLMRNSVCSHGCPQTTLIEGHIHCCKYGSHQVSTCFCDNKTALIVFVVSSLNKYQLWLIWGQLGIIDQLIFFAINVWNHGSLTQPLSSGALKWVCFQMIWYTFSENKPILCSYVLCVWPIWYRGETQDLTPISPHRVRLFEPSREADAVSPTKWWYEGICMVVGNMPQISLNQGQHQSSVILPRWQQEDPEPTVSTDHIYWRFWQLHQQTEALEFSEQCTSTQWSQ